MKNYDEGGIGEVHFPPFGVQAVVSWSVSIVCRRRSAPRSHGRPQCSRASLGVCFVARLSSVVVARFPRSVPFVFHASVARFFRARNSFRRVQSVRRVFETARLHRPRRSVFAASRTSYRPRLALWCPRIVQTSRSTATTARVSTLRCAWSSRRSPWSCLSSEFGGTVSPFDGSVPACVSLRLCCSACRCLCAWYAASMCFCVYNRVLSLRLALLSPAARRHTGVPAKECRRLPWIVVAATPRPGNLAAQTERGR